MKGNQDLIKIGKKGEDIDVADMNLAYDDKGKVMKMQKINADTMVDISEVKNIIKS